MASRHDDDTARNLPQRRVVDDGRFSSPKAIPEDLFDDLELPAAPSSVPAPPRAPVPAPPGASADAPRKPGAFGHSESRAPVQPEVYELLRGAELIERSAELPARGRFAGYDILGRLAIGGMAEILLARAPGEPRPVVLKKILTTYDRDDEFVQMFLDEARVGMQLNHPNIARFTGAGEEERQYFIAMEWVNGVTLGRLVRRAVPEGGLDPVVICTIVRDIADALHYAHTSRDERDALMGLIHRDVSPHNIMIGYNGDVKLLDFGIAKAMGAAHTTNPGVVKGKFAYMSPEQCEGETIDFRTDIFALGVVLYEALVGKTLYRRGSDRETVEAITREALPDLAKDWPVERGKAPRELIAIINAALAKDRAERFPTAAAMRDVLTLFLDGRGGAASPARIASVVQTHFASELESGPAVEAPLSAAPRPSVPPQPKPTLAPPARASRASMETEHAWSNDETAVQDAQEQRAVLARIRSDAPPKVEHLPEHAARTSSAAPRTPSSAPLAAPAQAPLPKAAPLPNEAQLASRSTSAPSRSSAPPARSALGWWIVAGIVMASFGALAVFIATR
ncbi:MAG: protein kinase [Myxococcota bacterium]